MDMNALSSLQDYIAIKIKNVYTTCLNRTEKLLTPDQFSKLRTEILNCGNTQIRDLQKELYKFDIDWGRQIITFTNNMSDRINKLKDKGDI